MTSPPSPPITEADLVSVQREGEAVVLHFGQRGQPVDGAVSGAERVRVALGAGGAAKLQELLAALLQEPAPLPEPAPPRR